MTTRMRQVNRGLH